MKYISIGNACSVKYNIDKYKGKCETLFFDWLITSMNSVIDILSSSNINTILYFDNIVRDINNPYHNKNSRIIIKSLDFCCSIHDFPAYYSDNDIINFIDKYTRRFNRIIEYIKSNEKICFIRNGFVSDPEIDKFIETIKKINPNCDFTLIVIDYNNKNINTNLIKKNHLLFINLNIKKPNENDWTLQFLNWKKIFSLIENNII
jgi:hypothetical protein